VALLRKNLQAIRLAYDEWENKKISSYSLGLWNLKTCSLRLWNLQACSLGL